MFQVSPQHASVASHNALCDTPRRVLTDASNRFSGCLQRVPLFSVVHFLFREVMVKDLRSAVKFDLPA